MPLPEIHPARQIVAADSMGSRKEQQDAALVLQSAEHGTALLLVSDGVGGNTGGRLASQTVKEVARTLWEEGSGLLADPPADLGRLCRMAHDRMNEEGQRLRLSPRATIVALYLSPTQAHWVHSGDSRLYHFRNGQLVDRTDDHSLVQVMVNQGMLREREMGRHPDQGALLQALGGVEYKEPAQGHVNAGPDDGFLLCTDGFWERTTVEEMGALAQCPPSQAQCLLQAAVETAVKRNGSKSDNVTAALAVQETAQETFGTTPPTMPVTSASSASFASPPMAAAASTPAFPVVRLAMVAVIAFMLLGLVAAALIWVLRPNPDSTTITAPVLPGFGHPSKPSNADGDVSPADTAVSNKARASSESPPPSAQQ